MLDRRTDDDQIRRADPFVQALVVNAAIDGTHGDGLLDRLVPADADDLSGEPGLPQGQAQ